MATDINKVICFAAIEEYRGLPMDWTGLGEAVEPGCNDILRIGLKANERQMITDAGYEVEGNPCSTLLACAAVVVSLIINKPVLTAYTISHRDIELLLSADGSLNKEHIHCAIMAELCLKKAAVEAAQHYISKKEANI